MNIIDFISADAVVPDFKASNKRQALQILARKAADIAGLEQHLVMDIPVSYTHLTLPTIYSV